MTKIERRKVTIFITFPFVNSPIINLKYEKIDYCIFTEGTHTFFSNFSLFGLATSQDFYLIDLKLVSTYVSRATTYLY